LKVISGEAHMNFGTTTQDFAKQESGEADPSGSNLTTPAVLLADDNTIICKVIVKILEPYQVRIHHVAQGDEALDALMTRDFALALIDANLPVMSGLEVTKCYRFAAIGRKRVPILGLVGAGTAGQIGACIGAGMDGCLTKPLDPAQLIEAVKSFVEMRTAVEFVPATPGSNVGTLPASTLATEPAEEAASDEPSAVNLRVLKDLEQLGGRQFVEDVVSQFVTDASRIFPDLAASIKIADVEASRDLLHALRSCAANVGANSVFELCLAWREISRDELVDRGEACLSRLQVAFDDARLCMRAYDPSKRAA
jgi:two-component system sensor histidine kinase RpfC